MNLKNKLLCAGLLVIAATLALVQWNSAGNWRRQNQELANANREAAQLAGENAKIPTLRAANAEAEKLRAETRDLLKLRNEVRKLREQKPEIEKLKADNARLASEIAAAKSNSAATPKLSDMPDFIAKETWADSGFATPEATVRTFFWAMNQKNFKRLLECFPDSEERMKDLIDPETGKVRGDATDGMERMTAMKGFRIVERRENGEDSVVLGLQVATGGEIMPLPLRRIGQEWKFDQVK